MILFSNMERCGFLPEFLSALDPRGAVEQIDGNYAHGGGWNDFNGFTLHDWVPGESDASPYLTYPGEFGRVEKYREVARATLRLETIILFEGDWTAVIQPDGSHRIARLD